RGFGRTPQEKERWKYFLDVARAADPDDWRTQVRNALAGKDREALVSLASSDEAARLLPWSWYAVGRALQQVGAAQQAEGLLRKAQRRHPDDFWINQCLAEVIQQSEHASGRETKVEEVIPFLRVCVALRPQSPGAHLNLGNALAKK